MDNNAFVVELPSLTQDKNGFYKKGLMDLVINKYPWLTVAGIDDPTRLKSGRELRGVEYAGAGNVITFGTAKSHDVNWIQRPDYAREKGYNPVYNLLKDWNTITSKLHTFAMAKKPVAKPTCGCYYTSGNSFFVDGQKVEIFDNFIKIGYNIIPRNLTSRELYAYTPATIKQIETVIVYLSR
jgi:hypothetical protein